MPDIPINPVPAPRQRPEVSHVRVHGRGAVAWWRPVSLGAALVAVVIFIITSDVREVLGGIHTLVDNLGIWGPVAFLLIFVVWVVLALPGSWLSVMAGAMWGAAIGFGIAMTGAVLGAAACFLIARYFAREPFARLAERSERFRRLDRLTQDHGALVVIVVRLIPLFPYNVTNYAFGLTAVGFWTYLFWSLICMVPGTLFLVAGSDALAQLITEGEAPPVLIAIAAISLAILSILIYFARRSLRWREESLERRST